MLSVSQLVGRVLLPEFLSFRLGHPYVFFLLFLSGSFLPIANCTATIFAIRGLQALYIVPLCITP